MLIRLAKIKKKYLFLSIVIIVVAVLLIITLQCIPDKIDQTTQNKQNDHEMVQHVDSVFAKGLSLFYKNTDSARNLILKELTHMPEHDVHSRMKLLNFIGASYQVQDNYEQAMDYYYKALQLVSGETDSSLLISVYNNIGYINQKTGNYRLALNFMLKALNINNTNHVTSSILNNIGIVYLSIDEFEKGETYFRQAFANSRVLKDSVSMATILTNLGFVFMNKEENDSAMYYLNNSLSLSEKINNDYAQILALNGLGDLFTQMNNYPKALYNYRKAEKLASGINDSYSKAYSIMGQSKLMSNQSKPVEALELANMAISVAKKLDNKILVYECKKLLSEIYEQASDFKLSLQYFHEYIQLKDQFVNQSAIRQVYNQEITFLNESNKIKQLEIEKQKLQLSRKNLLVFIIGMAFILSIIGIYFFFMNYRYRQNAKVQNIIMSLNEKKSRAAIEAEIQERTRIGQDLHDGLGQMLSVARLNISALNQKTGISEERKSELVDSALDSIDTAFNELRQISHNLAPSILITKGLAGAIQDMVLRINDSKRVKVKFEVFGLPKILDKLIENTLYRAIQELTNNAIKHAESTVISIQLIQNEKEITLMVEDNGIGFDFDFYQSNGLSSTGGINNIRSRVENLHGTIFFDSNKNRGTIVTITLPLISNGYGEN